MKLVTFAEGKRRGLGVWTERVLDLERAWRVVHGGAAPGSLVELVAGGLDRIEELARRGAERPDWWLDRAALRLLPPVPRPGKIVALGKNYADHAAETGSQPPEYPMLFLKPASALVGDGAPIVLPRLSAKIDFEGELAVVIGVTAKDVERDRALEYVAGYTIANDVSARDLQRRTSQFASGKMLDTFLPLGPALVTREAIVDPGDLRLTTRVNGLTMQDASTAGMLFDVAAIISYVSALATLEPGDVILTGTPAGVGFARRPPVYLKDGDLVEVEIEGLGKLANPVVATSPAD